jgi:hypothetical protein
MRLDQLEKDLQPKKIVEANVAAKIKDPKMIKQIAIAMRHDGTLPKHSVAKLGPKPEDQAVLQLWSDLLDQSLSRTRYGDISADGKFDDWITRLYINGQADYEDISGEAGDALGAWKALSLRGKLKPQHQDFNRFKSLTQIQSIIQSRDYRDELRRIADAAEIEKHKKDSKQHVIVDDKRFQAVIPFNYGSCYTFNNAEGFNASFCTGSSSGLRWFNNYAPDGPIISVIDKENHDDVNGKWQIHAPTNQINNGNQTIRSDERFSELFPGLMKKIVAGMLANEQAIKDGSKEVAPPEGYDIQKAVEDLKRRFPLSFASEEPAAETAEDGPGMYLVTHTASGKKAKINGESKEDVQQQLLARHPGVDLADFTFELQPEQPAGE